MKLDQNRKHALQKFLTHCGLSHASRTTVAGDASFRRYDRLTLDGESTILMDAPPPEENCLPFVAVAHYLDSVGLNAPIVLKQDLDLGFLLLEDLGDDTFNQVFTKSTDEEALLYQRSIDVLVDLHGHKVPASLTDKEGHSYPLASYDDALFNLELELFTDWYLPALKGQGNTNWGPELAKLWQPLQLHVIPDKPILVLRDYHADNLMWLPNLDGFKQIGLLDFQDAVMGHPAYDLVSLLMDARRDVHPGLMEDIVTYYLTMMKRKGTLIDAQDFWRAFHILGAQRNLKIIGIFARLWKRDGKPHYPTMIPHVWGLLERNLEHPSLAGLKSWIDNLVSPEERKLILSQAELDNE